MTWVQPHTVRLMPLFKKSWTTIKRLFSVVKNRAVLSYESELIVQYPFFFHFGDRENNLNKSGTQNLHLEAHKIH